MIILKSSKDWINSEFKNIVILDPDGWDRMNFNYSFNQELISKEELLFRLNKSTLSPLNFQDTSFN